MSGSRGALSDLFSVRLRPLPAVRVRLHRLVHLGVDFGGEQFLRVCLALVLVGGRARPQLALRLGDLEVPRQPSLDVRRTEQSLVVGRVQLASVPRVHLRADPELERRRPAPARALEHEEPRPVHQLLLRVRQDALRLRLVVVRQLVERGRPVSELVRSVRERVRQYEVNFPALLFRFWVFFAIFVPGILICSFLVIVHVFSVSNRILVLAVPPPGLARQGHSGHAQVRRVHQLSVALRLKLRSPFSVLQEALAHLVQAPRFLFVLFVSYCFDELAREPLFDDSRLGDSVRDPVQQLRDNRAPVRRGEVRQHLANDLADSIPPRYVPAVEVRQLALFRPRPPRRERLKQSQARIRPKLVLRDYEALR